MLSINEYQWVEICTQKPTVCVKPGNIFLIFYPNGDMYRHQSMLPIM
jgi:hypothetical protein